MARITITMPDSLHAQVLKFSKKEQSSVSYTISKLVELGLLVANNKNQKQEEQPSKIEEHCNKLIIQINGILKELATGHFELSPEKIAKITQETTDKYKELISQ
ncbi:hypothetical protein [Legionella jamestowniensis]|uniref:hypothetical protein n=1 Tax=Legionella jamestowniensis TaxID=455 RepID=UPI0008ED953D|nr:hypothetical protein [Legionella jamestowniensis]SFM08079.1 hypothetical protein SAMN02746073_0312 [Legionella jamestowniensis DSM 19215]